MSRRSGELVGCAAFPILPNTVSPPCAHSITFVTKNVLSQWSLQLSSPMHALHLLPPAAPLSQPPIGWLKAMNTQDEHLDLSLTVETYQSAIGWSETPKYRDEQIYPLVTLEKSQPAIS